MDGTYTALDIAQIHKLDVKAVLAAAEGRGYPKQMSIEEAEGIIKELGAEGDEEVHGAAYMLADTPLLRPAKPDTLPEWLVEIAKRVYEAGRADERAEWEGKPIAPVNVDELIKEVRRMG